MRHMGFGDRREGRDMETEKMRDDGLGDGREEEIWVLEIEERERERERDGCLR